MKRPDFFDMIHLALIGLVLLLLAFMLMGNRSGPPPSAGLDRAVEREMAAQARLALLQKVYAPVEDLIARGELQSALLTLDELGRSRPGDAHGRILQGMVMQRLGEPDQAIDSYSAGLRLNGEYLDKQSPLSRRPEISRLVEERRSDLLARAKADPSNRTVEDTVRNLYYLQSRLAGGCE